MSQMSHLHQFIRTETVRASSGARAGAVAIDEALDDMGAGIPPADALRQAIHDLQQALAHLHYVEGVRAALADGPEPFDRALRVAA